MNKLTRRQRVRTEISAHRGQLRFCLRMTVSGVSAFAIAQTLDIPLHGLWVVLTAVVVTQMSVSGSLRATVEYIIGTIGGAVYAGAIGVLIPHTTAVEQGGVLALVIAPMALAAAINPSFRVAPFSAVLVLLIWGQLGEGPVGSAVIRSLEVALGGAIAVAVSLLVFPERSHNLGLKAASRILENLARVLPDLLAGFARHADTAEIGRIQDEIGGAVAAFQEVAAETKRERLLHLAAEPDQGPLSRTLLRLRHDLVIIGRAAVMTLPDVFAQRLGSPLTRLSALASDFLRECASALARRTDPPPLDSVEAALKAYTSEVTSLRNEGLTLALSTVEVERVFALGFALEQMHQHFSDLERCVQEYALDFAK
jgi:uncharacterized membrane protein YccC